MVRQTIWESIANTPRNGISKQQLITGYAELVQRHVDQNGSNGFLMRFMFTSISGSPKSVLLQMNDEVQRVYSAFVTRVIRRPRSDSQKASLPLLITVPDRPVFKLKKQGLSDAKINDGLHIHGILCVPWQSRLKVDVPTHFGQKRALYVRNRLTRIDVEPIYSADVANVVDYAFKSLKNGNAAADDIRIYR